jgi:hypothetical protein
MVYNRLTYNQVSTSPADFVRMLRSIGLGRFRSFFSLAKAEYIRNDITSTSVATFGFHPQSDLHVRLAFGIRVILGILA